MRDTTAWHWPAVPTSDLISLSTTATSAPAPVATATPGADVTTPVSLAAADLTDGVALANIESESGVDHTALAITGSSGPLPNGVQPIIRPTKWAFCLSLLFFIAIGL